MNLDQYRKDKNLNPKVYCMGEVLLDIIFENNQPKFATPGGSMLNSAVSLGRKGNEVYMISDLGNDHTGEMIVSFLSENKIATRYIRRYNHGKTTLALAFLDKNRNASYTFYKDFPADRFPVELPEIHPGDVLLFGSFYSITDSIYPPLSKFVEEAAGKGAFILYDPNFRKPHLHELDKLRPMIIRNIGYASMVKGSDEDFRLIFNADDFESAFKAVSQAGCSNLIYTRNKDGVEAMLDGQYYHLPVPQIQPISTIGAGDSFNAGLIHAMINDSAPGSADHTSLLQTGIDFATKVCMSMENY